MRKLISYPYTRKFDWEERPLKVNTNKVMGFIYNHWKKFVREIQVEAEGLRKKSALNQAAKDRLRERVELEKRRVYKALSVMPTAYFNSEINVYKVVGNDCIQLGF